MKKTIVIAVLSGLIAIPAFAQNKAQKQPTPEMRAEQMTTEMIRELNLSPEQKEALYQANLRKTIAPADNTRVANDAEARYNADLKEILTEEQYTMYMEKKERQKQMEMKKSSRPTKKAPAEMEQNKAPQEDRSDAEERDQ